MKPNYEFIMKSLSLEIANSTNGTKSKVLDFGCGVGEVVEEGINRGINIYGVDTFDGYYSDWKNKLPEAIVENISNITAFLGNCPWNLNFLVNLLKVYDICGKRTCLALSINNELTT